VAGLVDGQVEHGFDPFPSLPVFVRGVFDLTAAQLISTRAANVSRRPGPPATPG
jgi:hypothetical protein